MATFACAQTVARDGTPTRAPKTEFSQAASNRPLAIFTLASSSVRAVNLRTRPVALCRTVQIISWLFSAALRESSRRILPKKLGEDSAFRDTSSQSANGSGMASPQSQSRAAPLPRGQTLTRNCQTDPTVPEESR
jgi:hypothetical protein